MRNLAPAIKVGLTFVVAAAMGYWSFMMLAKGSCAGDPEQLRIHAFFKDATLLVEKSRVQISGLNIGYIVSRELNVRPPRKALIRAKRFAKITVALNKGVTLYTNATIKKRSASLLGDFYLEIDPGTYEWWEHIESGQSVARAFCETMSKGACRRHVGEKIKDGDEITRVGELTTVTQVVQQVSDIMPEVKGLTQDIRRLINGPIRKIGEGIERGVEENRKAVAQIMANVDGITRDIRLVTSSANQDVRLIIEDIKAITGSVRGMAREGEQATKGVGEKLQAGLNKLSTALDKLDATLSNTDKITDGVEQGKGTIGRLLKDETLINDVEEMVQDASGLIKSITGLQTVVGLRSEYNFQAGTIKTYLSVELRPRPDKYYLIELIDDPRGRRSVSTEVTRSDDPSKPVLTREERVTVSDAFRLSFQIAKRISAFTFRFGIKESTGGLGADVHLFSDRMVLSTDLFDFQANIYPRLKALVAWEFFKRLYVVGGVDDAFNQRPRNGTGGGRDYILGAQIRFNDEDLKQLLLFGGSALGGVGK